jgi:hypothetical protein
MATNNMVPIPSKSVLSVVSFSFKAIIGTELAEFSAYLWEIYPTHTDEPG